MTTTKTIVITGGLGFIGSRFIKHVYEHTQYKIINIDKHTYAADHDRIPLPIRLDVDRYSFLEVDIRNLSDWNSDVPKAELLKAHYVVNFAAESHVDNSISDGKPFVRSNVEGVLSLLEFFKGSKNLKKFVQISTDEVYGDMTEVRGEQASDESYPLKPSSYYSASKASADLLVQSAERTFGIPYLITRSCNNFGPGQHKEKFLPTVFNSIKSGLPIPVYGNGEQIREWMHVDDNVANILELTQSTKAVNQVVNIGSGASLKNIEIIKLMGMYLEREPEMEFVKDRLGHDKAYRLDCTKLSKLVRARKYYPLREFLKDEAEKSNSIANGG
tara:strand:- start:1142 stop:2131 length:990 start_codon:yes stop_codon:yes gene_type:complete